MTNLDNVKIVLLSVYYFLILRIWTSMIFLLRIQVNDFSFKYLGKMNDVKNVLMSVYYFLITRIWKTMIFFTQNSS